MEHHPEKTRSAPTRGQLWHTVGVPLTLSILYLVLARPLYEHLGEGVGIISSVPSIVAAILGGAVVGGAWGLASAPLVALGHVIGESSRVFGTTELLGVAATTGVAVVIGRLQDLGHRLREARAEADAANEAKSAFLANVSHEMRTPLHGILGLTDLMLDAPDGARALDRLETIRASAEGLLAVINELLDLSRIERAEDTALTRRAFRIPMALARVERMLGPMVADGVSLRHTVHPTLPDWVEGDPKVLGQVLVNLVGNALKFTATGEVVVSVRPSGDDNVRVEVRDTGGGIPDEALDTIFEPFGQTPDGVARQGTGLGLTISRRLVERMGGVLRVESTVGRGSCFWFEVPLPKTDAPALEVAAPPPSTVQQGRTRRALVVDDATLNRTVACAMLTSLGWEVLEAEDGERALELLETQDVDVILMDWRMPVLDGPATTARIREREGDTRHTVIVAMTANAMEGERERCLAAGMDDYLGKPFRKAELVDLLERWTTEPALETPAAL